MSKGNDGARHLIRCAYLFDAVLARIPENQWESPTCCEGWAVTDCASHAIGVMVNLKNRAIGAEPVDYQDGSWAGDCLLYTSPSPRARTSARMPSSA